MSFVRDVDLLNVVADRLKLNSAAELPDYYASTIVPEANEGAYQEILGALLNRGYSKAQVDAWDRGAEFQRKLGVYFALVNSGAYAGMDPDTIQRLDVRGELLRVLVFVNGVWVKPPAGGPGLVATSGPSARGGIFNWPDPNDENLGQPTVW